MKYNEINLDEILYWLEFREEDCFFYWKRPKHRIKVGDRAGRYDRKGYYEIHINGKNYKAHRVIWTLRNGPIPPGMQIDHINGNKADNSDENLRLATHSENQINKGLSRNNSSGVKNIRKTTVTQKYNDKLYINEYWTVHMKKDGKRFVRSFPYDDDGHRAATSFKEMVQQEHQGKFLKI